MNIRKRRASNYSYPTRTNSLRSNTNIFRSNQEPLIRVWLFVHFITIFMYCGHKSKCSVVTSGTFKCRQKRQRVGFTNGLS